MSNNSTEALYALFLGTYLTTMILGVVMFIVSLIVSLILLIATWKIFVKAGEPGWASIVPFYNIWVLLKITCNNNVMWFVLSLIFPIAGFIVSCLGLAKVFGKNTGFGILSIFFSWITWPMLAFGSHEYTGDKL